MPEPISVISKIRELLATATSTDEDSVDTTILQIQEMLGDSDDYDVNRTEALAFIRAHYLQPQIQAAVLRLFQGPPHSRRPSGTTTDSPPASDTTDPAEAPPPAPDAVAPDATPTSTDDETPPPPDDE